VALQAAKELEQLQIQANPQEPKTAAPEQTLVVVVLISAATLVVEILVSSLFQFFDYLLPF
jgi:hypothetical protein